MIRTVSKIKDEFADREAIRDCLYRYSRGIDRCDMDMLRSVYWPGAMDNHSGGTAEEFIALAESKLRAMRHAVHMIGNILIEVNGSTAAVESYFWAVSVTSSWVVTVGRYLDRFERRDDEWRIAERCVVHDWFHQSTEAIDWQKSPFRMSGLEVGTVRPDDKSYAWLGLSSSSGNE